MHVHHLEKHNPSMPNNAITKQDKDANTPLSKANPSMHPSSTIAEEREEKQNSSIAEAAKPKTNPPTFCPTPERPEMRLAMKR
jgi:hypothetical protein